MTVNVVKFINGEEIIGETKIVNDSIVIKNAAQLIVVPQQARQGLGLAPYMPYTKTKSFDFQLSAVMTFAEPVEELLNEYNRIFGSGLVIAKTL